VLHLLKINEIRKKKVLVMMIKGPTGIPVKKVEPKIPRAQARLPEIIPP